MLAHVHTEIYRWRQETHTTPSIRTHVHTEAGIDTDTQTTPLIHAYLHRVRSTQGHRLPRMGIYSRRHTWTSTPNNPLTHRHPQSTILPLTHRHPHMHPSYPLTCAFVLEDMMGAYVDVYV